MLKLSSENFHKQDFNMLCKGSISKGRTTLLPGDEPGPGVTHKLTISIFPARNHKEGGFEIANGAGHDVSKRESFAFKVVGRCCFFGCHHCFTYC
ncbi:hypothetical protein L2E82_35053 [Cichorium intybus]|uniref:Uncharacterized protein n=1 Tax=Cichorium intybus TaxID=13427 RepID=A0ACB9BN77_CICIN|nr:hypothetical protein L2E82_35053 [Cichorium intybus]